MLVVVKEVKLRRATDKERVDAEKEVEILSLLNHTNIVTYFNHYIDGTSLLIEMEYCNGGTLNDKIYGQKELFAEEVLIQFSMSCWPVKFCVFFLVDIATLTNGTVTVLMVVMK